jgi:Zn-dependent metalloprotease
MKHLTELKFVILGAACAMQMHGQAQDRKTNKEDPRNWIKLDPSAKQSPAEVLHNIHFELGLSMVDSLHPVKVERDALGFQQHKFDQYHHGVRIEHGEFIVHQNADGSLYLANGVLYRGEELSPTPTISNAQAIEVALSAVPAQIYFWELDFWEKSIKEHTGREDATYYPTPELVFTPKSVADVHSGAPYFLAYKMNVRAHIPMDERTIYVDARSGEVIRELALASGCTSATIPTNYYGSRTVSTSQDAGQWRLFNDCAAGGGEVHVRNWNGSGTTVPPPSPTEITSSNNSWTSELQIFGGSTLWAIERTDAYFKNTHGRNAYNNSSGDLDIYINAIYLNSSNQPTNDNASYHGDGIMTVGIGSPDYVFPDPECISADPLEDALNTVDILAHEYGHAIDAAEANLTYQDESGALDESFADIYGCMVELYALGSNDWLMADERCTGAIRNIADPNDMGDPDTYLGTNWAPTGSTQPDNGGVHTNSGVQNYWFYLLSAGGSGTNDNGWTYNIAGIGTSQAMQIAYRNHTTYLTSSSNYANARQGAIQAAGDIFGECSQQQRMTANAWHAVGVGDSWHESVIVSNTGAQPTQGTYYSTGVIISPADGQAATMNNGYWIFRAGEAVVLQNGFHATASGSAAFRAVVEDCSNWP